MSDTTIRNLPTFDELLTAEVVQAIIDAELDAEPSSVEGTPVPSIRQRETDLIAMCRRFLTAYPAIETPDAENKATEVLSTLAKFAGGSGRVETVRQAIKAPVLDAGRKIDEAFGAVGTGLIVRPLTGPAKGRRVAPFTLAEKIVIALTLYKEKQAAKIRAEAQAEADRLAREAKVTEELAAKGSSLVSYEDAATASAAAEKQQAVASAPMNELTRSRGDLLGSTSGKRIRTFEIAVPHLVPRAYCVPSEALIRAAIGQADSAMPVILGVKITDVTDINRR